ncbi:MAG: hypothetical protein LUI10_04655 [Lachnospiraceae bacterium]|nr:hypothetical protein [Lachnospiraceae bacterium]
MGKMNELSQILDEMIEAGNRMVDAANALKRFYSTEDTAPEEKPKAKEPEKPTYTKEQVRQMLAAKSTAEDGKYRRQVVTLVRSYANGGSLTDIDPEKYGALVKELEVIGDA